jgi:hypothetical protein
MFSAEKIWRKAADVIQMKMADPDGVEVSPV